MAAGKKKQGSTGTERSLRDDAEDLLARSPKISGDLAGQTTEELIHELRVHQVELETQAEELRRTHIVLGESRDKFLDLYDFAPAGYLTLNDKALITEANLTVARLLGVERSELVNHGFGRFIAPIDHEEWDRYFVNMMNQGEKQICTLTLKRRDGSVFPARMEGIRTKGSGLATTISIAISDITDIWQIGALRESEEKYRALFAAESDGIFVVDKESGIIIDCNDAITPMYGYPKDEVIGQPNTTMSAEPDATRAATLEVKGLIPVRYHKRKDGRVFPVEITASIVPVKGHDVIVAAVRDITERMRVEEALALTSRKLHLLSSITRHDINNQLMSVNGFLELLHRAVPDPTLDDYFTRITKASSRIAAMIRFTREYEEIGVNTPGWQDIRLLVDTAAKQAPLGKVTVKNDFPVGTGVLADPLMAKVFYNLLDNAVRHGGKITTIRFSALVPVDEHIIVCEDDGVGVPAEEKEKIFERGFGKNTGLGLFLSREILDITGITIRETGEPGKGARFEITVPKGAWRKE
ncbi:MAG: PAS domain S-box protein [Methanomicrobiales archaeon]|nr:PAS domain S-box protein [Methanomicrobiales archaeon]